MLRRGMAELRLEAAARACRERQVTLSRAAELAGIDLWDPIARMDQLAIDLHADVDDFEADLAHDP